MHRAVDWRISVLLGIALSTACPPAWAADIPTPPSRQFCAPAAAGIEPLADRPTRSVKEFGAIGDGMADDTAALQAALDGVLPGTILHFPAGIYAYSKVLKLSRNNVVLRGEQATLQARDPAQQALLVAGDRTAVLGLTLEGTARKRLTTPQSAQLVIAGRWVQVVGNTVSGSASAGIFVDGAKDFRIAGNHVFGTKADGIHMTNGSRYGIVEGNVVHETGDDLIAVVSYRPARGAPANTGLSGNILIENNNVWGNNWGRGITVVGGHDVAIIRNKVRQVPSAAGIYLSQERSYRTYGDRDIYVADNFIGEIQTSPSPSGHAHPQHGAIDINTSNEAPLEFIDVENNVVEGAGFAGIRLLGEVCHIRLANNALKSVQKNSDGRPIAIIHDLIHGKCPEASLQCQGNTVDGKAVGTDGICMDSTKTEWRKPRAKQSAPHGTAWAACVP